MTEAIFLFNAAIKRGVLYGALSSILKLGSNDLDKKNSNWSSFPLVAEV